VHEEHEQDGAQERDEDGADAAEAVGEEGEHDAFKSDVAA